jgi:hypothetical protein
MKVTGIAFPSENFVSLSFSLTVRRFIYHLKLKNIKIFARLLLINKISLFFCYCNICLIQIKALGKRYVHRNVKGIFCISFLIASFGINAACQRAVL